MILVVTTPVLAGEGQERPGWFRLFEPAALLIAGVAVYFMVQSNNRLAGGLHSGFNQLIAGTTIISLSMAWKAIVEAGMIAEGLASELIMELFIIVGIIVIAVAAKKISETIQDAAK
jgi:hypothetical protein